MGFFTNTLFIIELWFNNSQTLIKKKSTLVDKEPESDQLLIKA